VNGVESTASSAVASAEDELVLEDAAAAGVGARLEHRAEPAAGIAQAERRERPGDRGRMMREVVDDGHAASLADHLLAAADAAELGQRRRPSSKPTPRHRP
jgi:hypothetical protein